MLTERLGFPTSLVRTCEELDTVAGLVLPGGESTTIIRLLERIGLDTAIRDRAERGMPVYGTCAGLILLAKEIEGRPEQHRLGLLDVTVARNAFGRQIDSFEADIPVQLSEGAEPSNVRGVFIRAPYVVHTGDDVQVLGQYRDKIVAIRQRNLLATAFHPELTQDDRVHRMFAEMVSQAAST
jgi:5'-phosphate synthase pdxT subunit